MGESLDPRIDPKAGDEVRVDNAIRRVIERDGERVFVSGARTHYWMHVDRWQEWCKYSDAVVVTRD